MENHDTQRPNSVFREILLFKEAFVEVLASLCGRWAGIVYDNTAKVCLFAALVVLGSFLGFIPNVMKFVDGAENLYAMPNTVARYDGLVHNSMFKESLTFPNFLIVSTNPPGGNVLTWRNLEIAQQIDNLIKGKVVDPSGGRRLALPGKEEYLPHKTNKGHRMVPSNNTSHIVPYAPLARKGAASRREFGLASTQNEVITYEDICAISPFGKCQIMSVFEMGVWDLKKVMPPNSEGPEFYIMEGNIFNLEKRGFVPDYVLGEPDVYECERELPTSILKNLYDDDRLMESSKPGYSRVRLECVRSAKALHFIYELEDKPEYLPRNLAWMDLYYKILADNKDFGGLLFGANAFKSRDDELRKSTSESQDIIFVVFTFIIVISYTAVMNFSCDLYKNKTFTALTGSISALLGIICGFGYGSLLGIEFVPTALVTPFLIMGVGTDDIFVLVNSYSLSYSEANSRERCIRAFHDCGVSVILTKATSLIAFAVGCQSPYISIRNFCLFSLLGLAFSVFFEVTFFFGVLCLEARREIRKDPCPFMLSLEEKPLDDEDAMVEALVKAHFPDRTISTFELATYQVAHDWKSRKGFEPYVAKDPLDITLNRRGNVIHYPSNHDPVMLAIAKYMEHQGKEVDLSASSTEILNAQDPSEITQGLRPYITPVVKAADNSMFYSEPYGTVGRAWRGFFRNCFCVHLLTPGMKWLVLLVFTCLFALAVRGVMLMELGLNLKDLSPDTAYLRVYDSLNDMYFGRYDIPVYIFFPEPSTPWWDHRVHKALRLLDKRLRDRPSTVFFNDPLIRMIDDPELRGTLTSGDRHTFEHALKESLGQGKYKQFEKDFVWEGEHLVGWKITLLPAGMSTSQERASWMREIRQDCLDIELMGHDRSIWPLKSTAWNYMMIFYESDLHLVSSVISSMTTAMISMFVAALVLIPEFVSGMLVIFVMSLIDLSVMGFMYYWDVKLQMITMICLVISIGFSIDYSAHICHTFTHCLGKTRNLRTVECVVLMGTPVFHGAASTIAGIFVLGYSQSFIFRLFFKMLTMTLLFGITHGLILLPVILSLVGKMSGPPISPKASVFLDHVQLRYLLDGKLMQRPASTTVQSRKESKKGEDTYSVATVEIPRHELHFQPTHWPAWDAPAPLAERINQNAMQSAMRSVTYHPGLTEKENLHYGPLSAGVTSAAVIGNHSDPASAPRHLGLESPSVATSTNQRAMDRHVQTTDVAFHTYVRHGRSSDLSPVEAPRNAMIYSRPASSRMGTKSAHWSDMSARDFSCCDYFARDFSPLSSMLRTASPAASYPTLPGRSGHPYIPQRIATDSAAVAIPKRHCRIGSSSDGRSDTGLSYTSELPTSFSEFLRIRTADNSTRRNPVVRSEALRQSIELARTIDQRWQRKQKDTMGQHLPQTTNLLDRLDFSREVPEENDAGFYTGRETRPHSRKSDTKVSPLIINGKYVASSQAGKYASAPATPSDSCCVVRINDENRLPKRKVTLAAEAIANIKTPRLIS